MCITINVIFFVYFHHVYDKYRVNIGLSVFRTKLRVLGHYVRLAISNFEFAFEMAFDYRFVF